MDRHPLDFVSLVFGLAFSILGIAIASGGLKLEDTGVDAAIPLGIGFFGLVLAAFVLNRYFRTHGEAVETGSAQAESEEDRKGLERESAPDRT